MIGKKNMVFGFFYLVLTMGLGMYLAYKLGSGPEWLSSSQKKALHMAHVHGNVEATLNVIIGYILANFRYRLSLNEWFAKTVSVILIIGAVFHSGMLYLGGLGLSFAFNLAPIGAIALIISMLLMGIGVLKLKYAENTQGK